MDEGGADAGVAVATEERVGVAMSHGALPILVNLVITTAMSVERGRVMEDVGHTTERQRCFSVGLQQVDIKLSTIFKANQFF